MAGAETLTLADTTEAWVFHILADPTGRSAVWAAQKVPDDHVAFVPNTMVIREMDLKSDDFMLSPNAIDIAKAQGFWDGVGTFNWAGTYGLGEYSVPHYSARRMWRAFDLIAPSLKLDPSKIITPEDSGYPFSVKPDKLLKITDVFRIYEDYYEGTPFSLVADTPAAGPFNSPLRFKEGPEEAKFPTGGWERPISIYRTNYAVVHACHPAGHGVVWIAPHTPHASIFVPVWTSAGPEIARPYVVDAKQKVDRMSLFWAANGVSNWAHGSMFNRAIVDIRAARAALEPQALELAAELNKAEPNSHFQLLAQFATKVHTEWWDLFWNLMGTYNDGFIITHGKDSSFTTAPVGYPAWWLKEVGFDHGVDAPSGAFADLKKRMADAQQVMDKINKQRHPIPEVVVVL